MRAIFLTLLILSTQLYASPKDKKMNTNITHNLEKNYNLEAHKERLRQQKNLTLPLDEELSLLTQLNEFGFGKFLLTNKGINGYWTAHMVLHGRHKKDLHPLDSWLMTKSPIILATQERFQIFKKHLQAALKSNMTLASVPCGLMDDLLGLDYTGLHNVKLVGLDLDSASLTLAHENAIEHKISFASFIKKDAWNLGVTKAYDIITSNGLNFYEKDDERVVKLYQEFYKALKTGGKLITSFLTPPPALSKDSPWHDVNPADALKQKAIFADIIQASFQCFRTESQTKEQLERAGFKNVEFFHDKCSLFPTVVAIK
jgi:SAM-dependent methyltransferase